MNAALNILIAIGGTAAVTKGLENVASSLSSIAPAAFTASGAILTLQKGLDLGGAYNDLSARTGQSVRDLVILERAFDTSGLGAGSAADSISKLQRAISGVNEEGKSTTEVFRRLKLSTDSLRSMTAIEQMNAITRSMEGIQDPAERTAIAMQLFGRSGAQMLQLFSDRSAISGAEQDVRRLADSMERNAKRFDDLGDRLSIAKIRLQEFQMAAVEHVIPVLDQVAKILNGINPSAAINGLMSLVKVYATYKASRGILNTFDDISAFFKKSAEKSGSSAGEGFLSKFVEKIGPGLRRAGLVAMFTQFALEIAEGIYSTIEGFRNSHLQDASDGFGATKRFNERASNIHSPSDRDRMIDEGNALIQQIREKLDEAKNRFWGDSEGEVRSYQEQLNQIIGTIGLLNSEWAQQRMEITAAADQALKEKNAVAWLRSEEANAIRDQLAKDVEEKRSYADRLANAKANLAVNEHNVAIGRAMSANAATHAQGVKILLPALARQWELTKQIAELQAIMADQEIQRKTGLLDDRKSALEADWISSQANKRAMNLQILKDENELIRDQISLLNKERDNANTTPERRGQIDDKVQQLRGTYNSNRKEISGPDSNSFSDQIVSGATAMQDQVGTVAEQIGRTFSNLGQTMRSTVGGALDDMILKGADFGDAMKGFGISMETSFINNLDAMVSDWIMSHVVMAGVKKIFHMEGVADQTLATTTEVGIHAAGEGAKTGSTFLGTLARKGIHLGATIFEGIQIGIRTTLHAIGETAKTGATLAGYAVRLPVILSESIASVFHAAVGALEAMASIPYVGPILAVAAMGAILAAGMGMVGKITGHADGGLIVGEGTGTSDSIIRRVSNGEYVIPAGRVQQYGVGFFDAIRSGQSIPQSSANYAAPIATTSATSQATAPIYIFNHVDETVGHTWLSSRSGRKIFNRAYSNGKAENGIPT